MIFVEPDINHAAAPTLKILIANMVHKNATDLHMRAKSPVLARINGALTPAEKWDQFTDSKGNYLPSINFESVRNALLHGTDGSSTTVYRIQNHQVRVQLLKDDRQIKLLLRLQPRTPAPIDNIFESSPKTLEMIANGKGLIVVCGPAGSGKTTLAAGMALYLSRLHRHVVTFEDPVEYYLEPEVGEISQFTCRMMSEGSGRSKNTTGNLESDANRLLAVLEEVVSRSQKAPRGPSGRLGSDQAELVMDGVLPSKRQERSIPTLEDCIPDSLRGDMDALYIGETRNAETLKICLNFAGAHEPVITTFQAGGIGHALARLIVTAGEAVGQETARLLIAQCVQAIFYVNLAFTQAGKPVPMVQCLPITGVNLTKAITENSPATLANMVAQNLKDAGPTSGVINRDKAAASARERGASKESVDVAMPPDKPS
jgi:Tfp pilus assembly pilus retraction ATPase PilT